MFLFESIKHAWQNVRGHKLRTGLTMFGIIWGITSMIILVGMGRSSQRLFYKEFQKIGEKLVQMSTGTSSSGLSGIKGGRPIRFTIDDVNAIRDHCPAVKLVTPQIEAGYQEVKYGNEALSCDTYGVDENSRIVRNMRLETGRYIAPNDVVKRLRVCLLGANVKEKLFGAERAFGEFIRIGGYRFQVVGVLARKGEQLSRNRSLDDDQVSIPSTTAQQLFTGSKYFDLILFQPYSLLAEEVARRQVRHTLAFRHGFAPDDPDALDFFGASEMIGRVKGVTIGMQVFLGAASIITLLIGGVGVMNVMFVSINERIREIGIIKAVGAKGRQVFLQFLVESMAVTLCAGLVGVLLGCLICLGIAMIKLPRLVAAPEIDPLILAISFSTMTVVGIVSGILPALRASRMQIVEALRSY